MRRGLHPYSVEILHRDFGWFKHDWTLYLHGYKEVTTYRSRTIIGGYVRAWMWILRRKAVTD